jgi:hypothetical protein
MVARFEETPKKVRRLSTHQSSFRHYTIIEYAHLSLPQWTNVPSAVSRKLARRYCPY